MTAPDRLALATRTRKARRTSTCPACRAPILIGMTIARLTDPRAWVHVLVRARRRRTAGNYHHDRGSRGRQVVGGAGPRQVYAQLRAQGYPG